jgi:hypothetical protein
LPNAKPNRINLDFEKTENTLKGWNIFGGSNYTAVVDTASVKSGSYSALIHPPGEEGLAWGFTSIQLCR